MTEKRFKFSRQFHNVGYGTVVRFFCDVAMIDASFALWYLIVPLLVFEKTIKRPTQFVRVTRVILYTHTIINQGLVLNQLEGRSLEADLQCRHLVKVIGVAICLENYKQNTMSYLSIICSKTTSICCWQLLYPRGTPSTHISVFIAKLGTK